MTLHEIIQRLKIWSAERCDPLCARSRGWLKLIPSACLVLFAMFVGWWMYPYQYTKWASIRELHAVWDHEKQIAHLTLRFNKRFQCSRVVVVKHLYPLAGNVVDTTHPIQMHGKLTVKLATAQVGETVIYDEAKPIVPLKGGHYQMVVVASCESNGETVYTADELRTAPVDTLMVVHNEPWSSLAEATFDASRG